jgi:polyhydroxyalkanoate synthase
MATAGVAGEAFAAPPDAARAARARVFETMTRGTDDFLRSAQFLQLTKQSLDASVAFRKQLNEFLTKAHHEAGGVARQDVNDLLSYLRRIEKTDGDASRSDRVAHGRDRSPARIAGGVRAQARARGNGEAPWSGPATEGPSHDELRVPSRMRLTVIAPTSSGRPRWPLLSEMGRNIQRIARVPFLWERAQAVKKGATPSEVVYEEDRLKLLHYTCDAPVRYRTPLVFVFALVNRPYILDLKDGKSVVQHFVKAGFDTYLVDWGIPTEADRYLALDDYINAYMPNVIKDVCQRTGSESASVLGYCMGGTMSAMFTALHQRLVKNLILMAAGVDFGDDADQRSGLLQRWTSADVLDIDLFVDAFGNAPSQFLQASFLDAQAGTELSWKSRSDCSSGFDDDAYVEDFLAIGGLAQRQHPRSRPRSSESFVKYLYQQNLLVKGKLRVGKQLVNLKNITCPVLNLMAQKDDLVPCSQSDAIQRPRGLKRPADNPVPGRAYRAGRRIEGTIGTLACPRVSGWPQGRELVQGQLEDRP